MNTVNIEKFAREFVLEEIEKGYTSKSSRLFRETTLEIYLNNMVDPGKVLDCGCGTGGIAIPLARLGCEVDAIDNNPEQIKKLDSIKGDLPIHAYCTTLEEFNHAKNTYDYVISRQFMSYFKNWQDILKMMLGYCKPGGTIIYHQHSSENMALSEKLAITNKNLNYVKSGYNRNSRFGASKKQILKACKKYKCELKDIIPVSFFSPQSLLYRTGLTREEIEKIRLKIEKYSEKDEILDFMKWYELEVMSEMPDSLSPSFICIIKNASY